MKQYSIYMSSGDKITETNTLKDDTLVCRKNRYIGQWEIRNFNETHLTSF